MTLGAEHATARKGGVTPEILHMAAGLRRKGYGWQDVSIQTGVNRETLKDMLSGVKTPSREPVSIERWPPRPKPKPIPATAAPGERIRATIRQIADKYGITPHDIIDANGGRHRMFSYPRMEAYSALFDLGYTTVRIGKIIGGRDHSTVIHGLAKYRAIHAWAEVARHSVPNWRLAA